jgi:hypothetical protein
MAIPRKAALRLQGRGSSASRWAAQPFRPLALCRGQRQRPVYHYDGGAARFVDQSDCPARGADRRRKVGGAPIAASDPRLTRWWCHQRGQSLIETLACQLLLHGNAYVQILKDAAGQPVELFALRPERVSP